MGSLTSRPEIPQVQQPVIMTMPATTSVPQASAISPAAPQTPSNDGEGTSGAEATRLAREDNLLRRSRGRMGTVLTGLGGILSQAAAPMRKTLLGE